MKTLRFFAPQKAEQSGTNDREILLYRRHAARALSEERWGVAEIFLNRILAVNPRHTETWLTKGHLSQHCHEDEHEAVRCYQKVITLCGHDMSHPHARRAQTELARLLNF